ncbi:MAG TPA: lysylphosphatidylglycerol synthase transmembrane domain-containing protein [Bacteroidales bacterium]|nr:lysylphosphatidylglycerol synthase transmembrane domain-containing protein [Bacteroidales bacterium]
MKRIFLQTFKFLSFLAIGLLILWIAFRKTDFHKLAEELKYANYSWLLLSLFFAILAFISRAMRWNILIRTLGYKPSAINSYHAVMTGYLANIALPRVGEITKCIALGKKEKIPVDQLIGTVIIERTIDFFSLMLITVGVLLTSSRQAVSFMNESIFLPLREKVVLVFGVTWVLWVTMLAFALLAFILLLKYKKALRKTKFFSKLFDTGRGVINGLKTITKLDRKWEFIGHTVFIWINYALMTWVVVFCLESTKDITLGQALFILVVGGLAMSAPVQSGFGVFHYAVSRAIVILAGVSLEDGLAYAILAHESQLIYVAVAGTVSFFLIFHRRNNNTAADLKA